MSINDIEGHTAYSPRVFDTLENLIAPGGCARLSPYVEAAQIQMLFGKSVDHQNRNRCIREIIKQKTDRIKILAQYWIKNRESGRLFSSNIYEESNFLEAYLVYYFSVNVAKVQITLLDLLRKEKILDETWRVVDIGVGVGTTAIAFCDFLFTWWTVCNLYQVDFPVKNVELIGLDKSKQVLEFSHELCFEYSKTLEIRHNQVGGEFFRILIDTIKETSWVTFDIEQNNQLAKGIQPTFLVVSNLFNELSKTGQLNLTRIIQQLPINSIALVIEPGDQKCSKALMGWRTRLVENADFIRLGPCGDELLSQPITSCHSCWNARRQSFHQPLLYAAFRQAAMEFVDDRRGFCEYENNLLSWSHIWVKRGLNNNKCDNKVILDDIVCSTDNIPLQYIGSYRGKSGLSNPGPVEYDPDDFPATPKDGCKEFVKLCPGFINKEGLTLVREPGFQVPNLRYGEMIQIRGGRIKQIQSDILKIYVDSESQVNKINQDNRDNRFLSEYGELSQVAIDEMSYRLFGFSSMYTYQHKILSRVLTGDSILGIAATGSGKSECFILPAILLPGLTVVVSPLKSLMMDQYQQRIYERYGLNHIVTFINGEVPFVERQARLKRMELGYYKLIYFTPEQLERDYVLNSLRRTDQNVGIKYLAMDEAHCISIWGHDFRPSYLNLNQRLGKYGVNPVRIALTATASPYVRKDICEELDLIPSLLEEGGDILVESSNRPELNLIVRVRHNTDNKVTDILDTLNQFFYEYQDGVKSGSAIIFMPHTGGNPDNYRHNRGDHQKGRFSAGVTAFASYLEREFDKRVSIYHSRIDKKESQEDDSREAIEKLGDLSGRNRGDEQLRFINNETQVMVATKGFGMGIDKDNIRLIIHRTPTINMESYAQEAGRAGRDGQLADVVLYYSPDSPTEEDTDGGHKKTKSDYEIQQYFLNEKYIRRTDIIMIYDFLKSVNRKIGGRIYFTNDEVIEFVEQLNQKEQTPGLLEDFKWPEFPRREKGQKESEEHARILDKGHDYKHKTNYVNRILQALYRIQPTLTGYKSKLALLDEVQKTGALLLRPRILNVKAILNSNTYFGAYLRAAEITQDEFVNYINENTIIPFAKRLGLSIRETADLLRDIKFAEGRFLHRAWKPELLDFNNIVSPYLVIPIDLQNLEKWRDFAGADRRADKQEAYRRAESNCRPITETYNPKKNRMEKKRYPVIDDWFWETELNKPVGWEVKLGPAFSDQIAFNQFLKAFMDLHDERKANDWASYHRMLTDYVGVNEDGSLQTKTNVADCLRSVLLGYLETYEVVNGESCYGCSVCVPDGNFSHYTLDDRRAVVVRMLPEHVSFFKLLKESEYTFPKPEQVSELFDVILNEEQAKQSYKGYFSGWSSRLLDENPNHKAALWLRFEGMARGIMKLQPSEFKNYSRQILNSLHPGLYKRFNSILCMVGPDYENDPDYYTLLANLYSQFNKPNQESDVLQRLIQLNEGDIIANRDTLFSAATRLVEIHSDRGMCPNTEHHDRFILVAARNAQKWEVSRSFYEKIVKNFSWEQVVRELELLERYENKLSLTAVVVYLWLKENPNQRRRQVIDWLLPNPEIVTSWPDPICNYVIGFFPEDIIIESRSLVELLVKASEDINWATKIALKFLSKGKNLSDEAKRKLFTNKSWNASLMFSLLEEVIPDVRKRLRVLNLLLPFISFKHWKEVKEWIKHLEKEHIKNLSNLHFLLGEAIKLSARSNARYDAVLELQEIFIPKYLDENLQKHMIDHWLPFYKNSPTLVKELAKISDLEKMEKDKKDLLIVFLGPISSQEGALVNSRIVFFKNRIEEFNRISGSRLITREITIKDLKALRKLFDWQNNPEQADMLAAILIFLQRRLTPNWKTLVGMLVEVLVLAGRKTYALNYVDDCDGDLKIYHEGHLIDAMDYINKIYVSERKPPIPNEYTKLVERMLK
jgi:superfamily II DNA/RNA helicase